MFLNSQLPKTIIFLNYLSEKYFKNCHLIYFENFIFFLQKHILPNGSICRKRIYTYAEKKKENNRENSVWANPRQCNMLLTISFVFYFPFSEYTGKKCV